MRPGPEMENIPRSQRLNIGIVIYVDIIVPAYKTKLPGRPEDQERNDNEEEDNQ